MAIQISASISKKIPIPGVEWSSKNASITITSEVSDLSQIDKESARLFSAADAIVDRQLGIAGAAVSIQPAAAAANPPVASVPAAAQARPFTGTRRPAPSSPSQVAFIERLIKDMGVEREAVLRDYGVTAFESLTVREAARCIDSLRAMAGK